MYCRVNESAGTSMSVCQAPLVSESRNWIKYVLFETAVKARSTWPGSVSNPIGSTLFVALIKLKALMSSVVVVKKSR